MADAKRATNLTKPPPRMDQATRAKSLLSLEVKVLTQTLGAENQWDELGDGVVEFNDLTIRVLQPRGAGASTTSSNAAKSSTTNPAAGATNPEGPNVLLEDNISTDTPFVGENCCIVWNSIEQQLSLCLMYASEEGYTASWSALVSLQEKAYPSFRFDLLERCGPDVKENRLPYSYFIHDQYDPPLGFIEQHALSLSVMEHGHSKRPQLYESREVTNALLNLANGDLLEHFLSEEVYPMVAKGLGCAAVPAAWTIPTGLTKLKIPEDMATLIAKDMRLAHMQEDLLPRTASADLITKLVICSHRIRNDLTCMLLSSDDMLVQAKDALLIAPPANSPLRQASHDGSYIVSSRSTESVTEVEQQVLSHLHFFRSLVALSLSELGRDLVGPVILKIYQCGLLEALSLVAERFAMPSGIASMFQMNLQDTKSGSPRKGVSPPASPNYYSPAIEQELTWLLDATIVRINERQEEQLMNEIVRTPVLSQPLKYNGLISFMCRQLVVGSGVKKMLRDGVGIRNPYLLFHALGLHDDEGSAGAERNSDNAVTETRNKFHHFVITKYLVQSMRGSLAMVPPPPASASSTHRGGPIIQFDSANASPLSNSASTLPQGISPPFIKILEYLLLLANSENREGLLKAIFSHKSRVLAFIEDCCTLAITNNKVIGLDVLCSNMRFLRMVVGKLADVQSQEDVGGVSSNTGNNSIFAANHAAAHQAHSNLPKSLSTTAARKLTAERDTFGAVLRAYEALGGSRRQTVFHASVLFLLDTIEKLCTKSDDLSSSLRCVRDFIFFKHLDRLPQQTVTRYREALLTETRMRLGAEEFGNNSVSVLSSTVSEMVHSASRLRFVDEVEAATGGVDGTVVPGTVANLSPAVVASVTSSEDKLAKRRSSRPNIEQWRPNSQPTPKTGEDAGLRANAPKGEKPPARPRSMGAMDALATPSSPQSQPSVPTSNPLAGKRSSLGTTAAPSGRLSGVGTSPSTNTLVGGMNGVGGTGVTSSNTNGPVGGSVGNGAAGEQQQQLSLPKIKKRTVSTTKRVQ